MNLSDSAILEILIEAAQVTCTHGDTCLACRDFRLLAECAEYILSQENPTILKCADEFELRKRNQPSMN